mgnify:CR=1 FL=1
MKSFPHLTGNDPAFPGQARNVYEQIPGAFDPSEWTEGTKLTLMSVPWGVYDPETSDSVPGFETPEERDEWFRTAVDTSYGTTEAHVLDTPVRYDMGKYADLPFTFDYTAKYNYLVVEYGAAPVSYGAQGVRKWYYHILDISYMSPSCTRVFLDPDWWTTFLPYINISNMFLQRGHMPVAATSVRNYLANPIDNCELLTTPDVNFGDSGRMRVASFEDLLFNSDAIPVIAVRGLQLEQPIGDDPQDIPISILQQQQNGAPAPSMWALESGDLFNFLYLWGFSAPQTIENLLGVYMIDKDMLTFTGEPVQQWGATLRRVAGGNRVQLNKTLTVDDFGYDSKYAKLAKLYTYPYAHLELLGSDGSVVEVRVEDLYGDGPALEVAFNSVFPYLTLDAALTNVGGDSRSLVFGAMTRTVGGEWQKNSITIDVPVYGVYIDKKTLAEYQGYYSRENSKKNAQIVYQNAMDQLATTFENTSDSIDTKLDNGHQQNITSQQNATASAETSYNNALASNTSGYNSATDSAETARDNANRSADAGYTTTMLSTETAKTNATLNATNARDNSLLQNQTSYDTGLKSANTQNTNTLASYATDLANTITSADVTQTEQNAAADVNLQNTKDSNTVTLANLDRTQSTNVTTATNNYDTQNLVLSENYSRQTAMRQRDLDIGNYSTNLDSINGTAEAIAMKALADELLDIEEAKGLQMISNSKELMQAQATTVRTAAQQTAAVDFIAGIGKAATSLNAGIAAPVSAFGNIIGSTLDYGASLANANVSYNSQVAMNTAQAIKASADLNASVTASAQTNMDQFRFNTEKALNSYGFAHGIDDSAYTFYDVNWKELIQNAFESVGFGGADSASGMSYKYQWDLAHINNNMDYDFAALQANRQNALDNLALSNEANKTNATNSVNTANANVERSVSTTKSNAKLTRDTTVNNANASNETSVANAGRDLTTTTENLATNKQTSDTVATNSFNTTSTVVTNDYNTSSANAVTSRDTSKSNATDTYTTTVGNAARTKSTADSNAKNTYDTTLENISRTKTTSDNVLETSSATERSNAQRSRDTGETIAKRNLQREQANIDASYKDSTVGPAVMLGSASSAPTATTRPMMLSVNVVTEDRGAIAQAGSAFLRYGYQLDQFIDFKTFNVMRYFSYWKCEDVFLTGLDEVPEKAQDIIRAMLYSGVTVWRDPNDIGKVNVYDN